MPKPPKPKMITLGFKISEYNPQSLRKHSIRELKKEYSRLRSAAKKRLERLEKSEFADSQVVAYNAGKYIPIAAIESESELRHLLSDVARFLVSAQGSLTGQREATGRLVRIWRDEKGFDFINPGNVRAWTEFLEYVNQMEGHVYELVSMSEAFQELELSNETRDTSYYQAAYELYQSYTSR